MFTAERRIRSAVIRNPAINWAHPIARNLLGCWLPGIMGPFDVTRQTLPLTPQSGVSLGMSSEGPGLLNNAANSFYVATAPAAYKDLTNGRTLFWRGNNFGTVQGFAQFIGLEYDNVGTSPFQVASIVNTTGSAQNISVGAAWNTGGTFTASSPNLTLSAGLHDIAATFVVGGNVTPYMDAVAATPSAFGAAAPITTSTSTISFGGNIPGGTTQYTNSTIHMVAIWNRVLSPQEIQSLHLDPYQFIVPADAIIIGLSVPPPVFILMPQACL